MFNSQDGGFPWDDLCNILPGCQWVAKVPNGVEILRKISIPWAHERYRRQTSDGRTGDDIANVRLWQTLCHFLCFWCSCVFKNKLCQFHGFRKRYVSMTQNIAWIVFYSATGVSIEVQRIMFWSKWSMSMMSLSSSSSHKPVQWWCLTSGCSLFDDW